MTIAFAGHRITNTQYSGIRWPLGGVSWHMEKAWRNWLQAAIVRRMDPDTLLDIGFSHDYIRIDWQDFAARHPELVAPAARSARGT